MLRLIVRDLLVPGSISFLLLTVTAGIAALYIGPRARKWSRVWLTAIACMYWFMGTSACAGWMERWIDGEYLHLSDHENIPNDISAIVVLSGGGNTFRNDIYEINIPGHQTAYRTLAAIRLHNMLPETMLLVSGGIGDPQGLAKPESVIMRDELLDAGVPAQLIVLETSSRNTHEQAINVTSMLQERNIDSFLLVTSAAHMRRSLGTFTAQGLQPFPSIAQSSSDGMPTTRWPWLTQSGALNRSRAVMRELLALAYYQQQGWVVQQP